MRDRLQIFERTDEIELLTEVRPERIESDVKPIERIDRLVNLDAAFADAFADHYPSPPIRGVEPRRLYVAPVGEAPRLSPEAEAFLVHVTQAVNARLQQESHARWTDGMRSPYFTLMIRQRETNQSIINTIQTAYDLSELNPRLHLVFPQAGATPLAILAKNVGISSDRIHADVDISGSNGTETGRARFRRDPPDAILDPNNDVALGEDLADSVITTLVLARERNLRRDPKRFDAHYWMDIEQALFLAHKNGNMENPRNPMYPAYGKFVQACRKEHMVLLDVWSKNEELSSYLRAESATRGLDNWLRMQTIALRALTPLVNEWVMGAGLLDTGILLSRLKDYQPGLEDIPGFRQLIRSDRDQWLLRIGTKIEGMVYVDTNLGHEQNLIKLTADTMMEMARMRYRLLNSIS